jgi:hypothetical protein
MIAQTTIEEVALPIDAVFCGHIFLPVFNHRCHARLARECEDGVQMIRHEQAKPAMPRELLVIMFYRRQHGTAYVRVAQLILAPGHTVNGDEKPTAFSDPLRNCVRHLFAEGQIHVGSVTKWANQLNTRAGARNQLRGAGSDTPYQPTRGAHGSGAPYLLAVRFGRAGPDASGHAASRARTTAPFTNGARGVTRPTFHSLAASLSQSSGTREFHSRVPGQDSLITNYYSHYHYGVGRGLGVG